jgi:hypothetical protein
MTIENYEENYRHKCVDNARVQLDDGSIITGAFFGEVK